MIGYFGMGDFNIWELLWCDVFWWLDFEDVDEELLVDGEECDYDLDWDEVSEEKDDDLECFELKFVVVCIICFFMVFFVFFKVIFIIFIVYMFCCCVCCCDCGEFLFVVKFKFNFRLDFFLFDELGSVRGWVLGFFVLFRFKMLWLFSWRFYSCLFVENESSCCFMGLFLCGFVFFEEVDDVEVFKFFL